MTYEAFYAVLEWLYSACPTSLKQRNAHDVLIACDMFGVEPLKNLAGDMLLKTVTIDNVASLYAVAECYNAEKLKEALMKFIIKNKSIIQNKEHGDDDTIIFVVDQ